MRWPTLKKLHSLVLAIEVHVAARRLRRIVPLGIRPNGTIPLRGERPSSGSTRPFESSPGVFIMRKAVATIRRRNTLSAVPSAIQKPAVQANNPAYRRLQCFFVLTKGLSVIGPRPVTLEEAYEYGNARDKVLACSRASPVGGRLRTEMTLLGRAGSARRASCGNGNTEPVTAFANMPNT